MANDAWMPLSSRDPKSDELATPLVDVDGQGLPLFSRGEVRDTFDLDHHLLMVFTDRVSANGVVLPRDPRQGQAHSWVVEVVVRQDQRPLPKPPGRRRR